VWPSIAKDATKHHISCCPQLASPRAALENRASKSPLQQGKQSKAEQQQQANKDSRASISVAK